VSAPFGRRCLKSCTLAPSSHPAHRTGQADHPHPALGRDFTPSPTPRRAQAGSAVRARSARKGARVDRSRPCVVGASARFAAASGRCRAPIEYAEKAIRLSPRDPLLYLFENFRGNGYFLLKNDGKAIEALRRSVALAPRPWPHAELVASLARERSTNYRDADGFAAQPIDRVRQPSAGKRRR
jgi:hypothetical protein